MEMKCILHHSDKYKEEIVAIRRDFHKYAEGAWREFRTTSKIIEKMNAAGIPVKFGLDVVNPDFVWSYPEPEELELHKKRAIEQGANAELVEKMQGYTGAVATIDSGKPGPVIGLRFDIDCNDVLESTDEEHRPYKEGFASINENFAHACGHDGNAAMGIITALVLNEVKDQLCGKVKIIFQLGEEGDKGAQSMVERGVVDDVNYLLATHLSNCVKGPKYELISSIAGLFSTTKFDVMIKGTNAHAGGMPQDGNNAILAACSAIMMMNSFLQDAKGVTRLNVGTIQGGTGRNVIPGECFFRMETRGQTTEAEQRLYNAALESVKAACNVYGCTFTTEKMGFAPSAEANPELVEIIMEAGKNVPELGSVIPTYVNTGGTDDITIMMQRVQENGGMASYMFMGTDLYGNPHHGRFDFDEGVLIAGVKCNLAVVCQLMEK